MSKGININRRINFLTKSRVSCSSRSSEKGRPSVVANKVKTKKAQTCRKIIAEPRAIFFFSSTVAYKVVELLSRTVIRQWQRSPFYSEIDNRFVWLQWVDVGRCRLPDRWRSVHPIKLWNKFALCYYSVNNNQNWYEKAKTVYFILYAMTVHWINGNAFDREIVVCIDEEKSQVNWAAVLCTLTITWFTVSFIYLFVLIFVKTSVKWVDLSQPNVYVA